jgi:hypothetical protein
MDFILSFYGWFVLIGHDGILEILREVPSGFVSPIRTTIS